MDRTQTILVSIAVLICFVGLLFGCAGKEYYIDLGKNDRIVVSAQDGTNRDVIITIER